MVALSTIARNGTCSRTTLDIIFRFVNIFNKNKNINLTNNYIHHINKNNGYHLEEIKSTCSGKLHTLVIIVLFIFRYGFHPIYKTNTSKDIFL